MCLDWKDSNQGLEAGLDARCHSPLGNFVLPVLIVLSSAGLEGLIHKGATLLPGDISNGKLRLPPVTFCIPYVQGPTGKKDSHILACITGPDHQTKAGLLFSTGARRIMCGSQVVSWYLLVLAGTLLPHYNYEWTSAAIPD